MAKKPVAQDYHRQLDIIAPSALEKYTVTMLGAGGVGSPTAMALAKMGVTNMKVVDFDKAEPHNLPNQFYPLDACGKKKVVALHDEILRYTGTNILALDGRMKTSGEFKELLFAEHEIVIAGPDNMKARKLAFEACEGNAHVRALIECRVTYPHMVLQVVNPNNAKSCATYKETLFDDNDPDIIEGKCTARATIYTSLIAASFICMAVRKVVMEGVNYIRQDIHFDPFQIMEFIE